VEIHPSARKHAIADEDIEHATRNAMTIDDLEDDLRPYLGPARDAALLEVVYSASTSSGACSTSCEHTSIHGSYGTARSSEHAPQQTGNPSTFAPNAAHDANRVFPILGSPDNVTT
jgi:hypothetical protein